MRMNGEKLSNLMSLFSTLKLTYFNLISGSLGANMEEDRLHLCFLCLLLAVAAPFVLAGVLLPVALPFPRLFFGDFDDDDDDDGGGGGGGEHLAI